MKRLFILIPIACIAFFACNKTPKEESIAKIEVKASAATEITLTEATISGAYVIEPSSIKAEEVGFFYGTDATLKECEKVISEDQGGKFNSEIGDLTSETKYYFQAYITVRNEIKFSSILSFTTKGEAVITTDEVTNITTTSATCGGNITSDGGLAITERGICYSTSQNPTTADSKVAATSAGTGAYSCDISGLTKNTTY